MNQKKATVFLLLWLVFGFSVFAISCTENGFVGNREAASNSYLLEIESMNGSDLHNMELNEGDTLEILFETEKGVLQMRIKAPNGAVIYEGNGKEITDFTINISESGVYTINVEAKGAKGTIHIQTKEKTR